MTLGLYIGAAITAVLGLGAFFLSTRPILFSRLFVSHAERLYVRRELLEDKRFAPRMRMRGSLLLVTSGVLCAVAASMDERLLATLKRLRDQ